MKVLHQKKYDVVALGELLVDFTQNGISSNGNWLLEANPGGAPCNVLSMLQSLNHKTAFIGKVGQDMFGEMLKEKVSSLGIDITNLVMTTEQKTTLAFVHTSSDGDRSFSFYRNPGADASLTKDEVASDIIKQSKIFHYGTLSMTNDVVNSATEYALEIAQNNGVLKSFDPNLRMKLWDSETHAKERIWFGVSKCNVLKIAEEELEFITSESNIQKGVDIIRSKYSIPLITVTKGKEGCFASFDNGSEVLSESCPTFTNVKTIDTTGAGDTFCACILHSILQNGYESFTADYFHNMLMFANVASSLITTRRGSLFVMPKQDEIQKLLMLNGNPNTTFVI